MWFTETSPPVPIGVYDHEDDIPGVDSIELPTGSITRFLRDATGLAEKIDDALPGLGDVWRILKPG